MSNYIMNEQELSNLKEKIGTRFLEQLVNTQNGEIKDLLSSDSMNTMVEAFVNALIQIDFDLFMGYDKYSRDNNKLNYRNGTRIRALVTSIGELNVIVPQDRNCEFHSACLAPYKRRTDEMTNCIIGLYQKGLSNSEVVSFVDNVFGKKYSPQIVSQITEVVNDLVDKFKNRKFNKNYIAIFMDATYVPIQFENKYEKQALHLIVGLDEQGHQDILSYRMGFTENMTLWSEVLDDLKERGVESVDVFVSDGVVGLEQVIKSRFPKSLLQRCTVHITRNVKNKVKVGDKREMVEDLTNLFQISDTETSLIKRNVLLDKWISYTTILETLFNNEHIFSYLQFPSSFQQTIRTTNRIEAVNQKIKRLISHKQEFKSVDSFERILVSGILQMNKNSTHTARGFQSYMNKK